jgi:hypothetical protein
MDIAVLSANKNLGEGTLIDSNANVFMSIVEPPFLQMQVGFSNVAPERAITTHKDP